MHANEAKPLIESLANGIDPESGEIFPPHSPYNQPRIIRALYTASRALEQLEKREKRESALPDNAGKAWTEQEDEQLATGFAQGAGIRELAARHERTPGAVTSRLMKLGKIALPG